MIRLIRVRTLDDLTRFAGALDAAEGLSEAELQSLICHFARVQAPREPEPTSELIVLGGRRGSHGNSRKPGHILLSWRRLFEVGPDVGVAGLGIGTGGPFGHVVIALYIWGKVWRGMEVELGDAEASVVEALWRSGACRRGLPADEAFAATNVLRSERGVVVLERSHYEQAINTLLSLRSVRLREDVVSLVEWVRKAT